MSTRGICLLLGVMGAVACSDTTTGPEMIDSSKIQLDVVSGNQQQGEPGTMLPSPLVVRVLDASGQPIANHFVNFVVTGGGGSLYSGSTMTNANGIAQDWWILGSSGTNTVEVRAVDGSTGEKKLYASFSAEAGTTSAPPADTVPDAPASVDVTTAPMTRDTFSVTANWTPSPDAVSYEWTSSSNNGAWSTSGSVPATSATFTAPVVNKSNYSLCVRSVDAAQRRSANTCVSYKSVKAGRG